MGPSGLYRVKPAAQRALRPVVDALVSRGVKADTLTFSAVGIAAAGGLCLALSDPAPITLLAVPLLAAARLVLNLLDGQVARLGGTARPMGEVWNELADRVADTLFIGGLAFVAAVGPLLGLGAVVASLLASYAGVASRAAGGPRQYGGVMSKPGRMIVLAVAAPLAFVLDDPRALAIAAWAVLVGALLTLLARLRTAARELGDAA